ncbi:MAG: Transcription elongation factor GreA [uncultured Thermomicrobiales bacterium]|uniref:Transcription elongation factor GreA n=1 Tax=uncultured Thermomicrobiales bacterium TaxID=1645740 RepID=A0A6J4UA72_9BACT|nr:MAG: Transcription elongation factor GreA [uncultured Thermomicrobiales bacterium]
MATGRTIQLTRDGKARLEEELRQLREVRLPGITSQMQESVESGDNDDGSETEPLKEEYATVEARIRDLERTIEVAEIIPEGSPDGVIGLGSHVTIRSDDGDETWVIVGPEEADAPEGRLSSESPVGKALMGARAAETIVVTTPGGEISYEVIAVD